MVKAKTLLRRKKFLENTPKLHLKKGAKVVKHHPLKTLLNEKLIAQVFWECLKENDPEGAMEVIAIHLNAVNKVHLAEEADLPRLTIYHSLKSKNPTLKTVAKLIHCSM